MNANRNLDVIAHGAENSVDEATRIEESLYLANSLIGKVLVSGNPTNAENYDLCCHHADHRSVRLPKAGINGHPVNTFYNAP